MNTNNNTTTYDNIESLTLQTNFALGYQISSIAGRLAEKFADKTKTTAQGVRGTLNKILDAYKICTNSDILSEVREKEFAIQYAKIKDCDKYERMIYNPVSESYEFA